MFFKAPYIQAGKKKKKLLQFLQVTTLPTQTTTSTYLKMIQWLNVRAVRAIKASMFEGRTPLPALSLLPLLSLLIPLFPFLSPLSSLIIHPRPRRHPTQAGLRADVQTLSFRLGPHCQLRALLSLQSRVPDLSSDCRPRPAAREDLIKQHSFSSTSVNSNAVTHITVRESGERPG